MTRIPIRSRPPPAPAPRVTLPAPGRPRAGGLKLRSSRPPRVETRNDPRPRSPFAESAVRIRFVTAPGSEILDSCHAFVTAYSKLRYRSLVGEKVTLAAYELLSNALLYGSLVGGVVFQLADHEDRVEVRVENDAVPARIEVLTERVARLQRDAQAVFLEELRRSLAQGVARAMLGLARVRHEAGMDLTVNVSGSRVEVVASTRR